MKEDDRAEAFLERLIEDALDGVRKCRETNDAVRTKLRDLAIADAEIDRLIAEAEAYRLPS